MPLHPPSPAARLGASACWASTPSYSAALEVATLRALRELLQLAIVSDPAAADALPEPYRRRARHVITEDNRVLRAITGVDAAAFGALIHASHANLLDDDKVSIPPLHYLVALLQADPGVFGARLTVAGFGSACLALCRAGHAQAVATRLLARYNASGQRGRLLVPAQRAG